MTLKTSLATQVGRATQNILKRTTSGGTSLPGKLAQRFDPQLLTNLSKDYDVIIITGTNGKSVTTALTVNILKQAYPHVMTNDSGSNMLQGIISSFISDYRDAKKHNGKKLAVLEVDEASLRHVTEHIKPLAILTTNIFRDQMDRYGEIYTTYNFILEGAKKSPKTVLLMNGDAPIFSSKPLSNPVKYFGFYNDDQTTDKLAENNTDGVICPECEHILHYHSITYSNLGDFFCPNCGFKRPKLDYGVNQLLELTPESAQFQMDGYTYDIPVAGLYNIYNALAAYTIGRFMNVSQEDIYKGLKGAQRMFGRQEALTIDQHDVRINLIKNPVGLNQVIDLVALEKEDFTLITILNDRPADGQDISWIWDGNFEELAELSNIKNGFVSGLRVNDLKKRMAVAGFSDEQLIPLDTIPKIIEAIRQSPQEKVYILATYTALLNIRKELANQGYVKERMQ
ncbi:MurT ligase domain-containing protein [Aerococcus suis]|nr:Mur ligase family protein [Aerococcus suis]